jgi:hypothetical protein
MFGRLPAFGFFCRHVRGLRLHDVQVGTAKSDARPGLGCDDVQQLEVRGWHAASSPAQGEEIVLRNTSDAWLHGNRCAGGAAALVRVSGAKSRAIKLSDNWCPGAARAAVLDPDVPAGAVAQD